VERADFTATSDSVAWSLCLATLDSLSQHSGQSIVVRSFFFKRNENPINHSFSCLEESYSRVTWRVVAASVFVLNSKGVLWLLVEHGLHDLLVFWFVCASTWNVKVVLIRMAAV